MRRLPLLALGLALAVSAPRAGEKPPVRPLVADRGSSAMPAWSPDGTRIVFHSRRKAEKDDAMAARNIWSIAADGTDERRLTKGEKDEYHASLSLDGRKLLFVSELNGSRDIWIADADGQNAVPLTDDPGMEDQPAWSPDSRQVVYTAFPKEGGSLDLWLVNADGSGRRRLTTTPANEIFPAWHPGGEEIVYVTDASGNFDIHVIDVRDGRTTPLITSPDHEARPAWSPDGTKLAFARWPAGGEGSQSTLWVANANGSVPTRLVDAPAAATHPAWAPGGQRLAFQHRSGAAWEIWTLALPATVGGKGGLWPGPDGREVDADVVQLRDASALRGTLQEARFRVRAAYGAVELPRAALASILFGSGERGLARVVLANGDTMTGFLDADELHLATGGRTERVPVERVTQLNLRPERTRSAAGAFRAIMRNGDSLLVTASFGPLRLRVGDRAVALEAARIQRIDFAEAGDKATVALTGGDSMTGTLAGERLELALAVGPRLAVHPSSIRSLVREGAPG